MNSSTRLIHAFVVVVSMAFASSLRADVFNINTGTSINWELAASWTKVSGAGSQTYPGASDSVEISGSGTSTMVLGANISVTNLSYSSGVSRTITMRPTGDGLTRTLSVSGNITMDGDGTWTFYNANQVTNTLMNVNISGNVSVSSGTLEFGRLSNNSALQGLSIAGTTTVSGGTLNLSLATDSTNGALIINSGTLYIGAGTPVGGNRTVSFTSLSGTGGTIDERVATTAVANTLAITGSATTAYSGTIMDSTGTATLAFQKSGTGTQTLSGANSYTGGTTISNGTLVAASNKALGNGDILINGGQLSMNGSTIQSLTLGTGSDFAMTSGTLLLNYASPASYDSIIGTAGGVFSLSGGTIDLSNSLWDYSLTYNIFSGFGSGSVSGLNFINYDTANWIASISSGGVLSFAAVPEPSTGLLAMVGILLAGRRRRQG